jgi:hypothetical protein
MQAYRAPALVMYLAMATYPTAKTASTRATATKAAPMADSPVTAYMVVTTPATTVMGAMAERMK